MVVLTEKLVDANDDAVRKVGVLLMDLAYLGHQLGAPVSFDDSLVGDARYSKTIGRRTVATPSSVMFAAMALASSKSSSVALRSLVTAVSTLLSYILAWAHNLWSRARQSHNVIGRRNIPLDLVLE